MAVSIDAIETNSFDDLLKPKQPRTRKVTSESIEKINSIAESPSQQKSTGWSNDDIETFGFMFGMVLLGATELISQRVTQSSDLAMSIDERDAISKAMARILLRHMQIKRAKRGDVTDGVAIFCGLATYSMRVYNTAYERKLTNKQSAETETSGNNQNNFNGFRAIQ